MQGRFTGYGLGWIDMLQVATASAALGLNATLLLCNYRRGKHRWSTDGILIAINAALDCVISASLLVANLLRLLSPAAVYDGSLWCQINYITDQACGAACLNIVMLLALVRYLVIVRNCNPYPLLWTSVALVLLLGLLFALAFRSSDVPLYVYPSGMYCLPVSPRRGEMSTFSLVCLLFYIPHFFIIPFCYLRLSVHYSRIVRGFESGTASCLRRKVLGLLVVVGAYWVALLPHILASNGVRYFHLPLAPLLDAVLYWQKCCFLLINALFPILFHHEIQANFRQIFGSRSEFATLNK